MHLIAQKAYPSHEIRCKKYRDEHRQQEAGGNVKNISERKLLCRTRYDSIRLHKIYLKKVACMIVVEVGRNRVALVCQRRFSRKLDRVFFRAVKFKVGRCEYFAEVVFGYIAVKNHSVLNSEDNVENLVLHKRFYPVLIDVNDHNAKAPAVFRLYLADIAKIAF